MASGLVVLGSTLVLSACGSSAPARSSQRQSQQGSSTSTATSSARVPSSVGSSRSASSASCLSPGAPIQASELAPALASVQFVSPDQGWAAGAAGILVTGDGGAHWRTQVTLGQAVGQLDFVSASEGWAVAAHELLGTSDGGRCWVRLDEPAVGHLRTVHFVSPEVGFGVAGGTAPLLGTGETPPGQEGFGQPFAPVPPRQGGVLVVTTDGGRSWRTLANAPRNAQSVCFVSGSLGWLGAGGGLYRSTDGGASWTEIADPGAASGAAPRGTDEVVLDCGAPSELAAAVTTGGAAAGNSPWALAAGVGGRAISVLQADMFEGAPLDTPVTPGSYPGPVSVIGSGAFAAAGWTPAASAPEMAKVEVLQTNGTVLQPARGVPGLGDPTGLAFLSARQGWVVGVAASGGSLEFTRGVIERTTDGGASWTLQDTVGS